MALKNFPPDTPEDAAKRATSIERLRPARERIAAGDLSVISIGGRCVTSGLLNIFGLRPKAYPFDWLFSSLPMVEHCLRTDFAEFLNPDHIEPVPVERRPKPTVGRAHHRLYRETFGVEHVFNHHEMPETLPHFERAVERFRAAPNPQLLHIARHPPAHILPQVEAVAAATDAKVLAVSVLTDPTCASPEVRHFASGDGYELYEMTAEAPIQPLSFGCADDETAFSELLAERLG